MVDDFRTSRTLPIQGSPQIFWPDGSTTHNPGMTDRRWNGDLVRIGHTESSEPERLLLAAWKAARSAAGEPADRAGRSA